MEQARKRYRSFLWICLVITSVALVCLFYHNIKEQVPDEVHIFSEESAELDEIFDLPALTYEAVLEPEGSGSYQVACSFYGIVPLKTVQVYTMETEYVYASGSPIGIYMETDGVMVIDHGEIKDENGLWQSPAKDILKAGDYIQSANGHQLKDKDALVKLLEENHGESIELEVIRNDERLKLTVNPTRTEENDYKLGVWVRDNMQGIGTLTYVDSRCNFGALGHGISDIDTGERLQISKGAVYDADIIAIEKGEAGKPGEYKGIIDYEKINEIGSVTRNTENGIGGTLKEACMGRVHKVLYPIGLKQEVTVGAAMIYCDTGNGVDMYEIEIEDIQWNAKQNNKSFVIRVTDERLLEQTGGIVQGMSGSPILQDGKIIGAVTHVLVNDPTMGYGIFIENMLDAAG